MGADSSSVSKLISELVNNKNKYLNKIVYMKHFETYCIDKQNVVDALKDENVYLLYHKFSMTKIQNAYEPFLDWIKILYEISGDNSVDEFLENSNVYNIHRDIFKSFILTGECKRNEEMIISELKYEKFRMLQDFINIFEYVGSRRTVLIVLNKLHFAPSSTMEIVETFMKHVIENNIYMIVTYNDAYHARGYTTAQWKSVVRISSYACTDVSWAISDQIQIKAEKPEIDNFNTNISELKEYITIINNQIETLAYEQADYYLAIIYQRLENSEESVDIETKIHFLYLYMRTQVYLEDWPNALLLLDKIKYSAGKISSIEYDFEAWYYSGLIFSMSNQIDMVNNCIEMCKSINLLEHNDFFDFKINILDCLKYYNGFCSFSMTENSLIMNSPIIEQAEKFKYYNHLAYLCTNCRENCFESIKQEVSDPSYTGYLKKGITLAQEIGNDNVILIFYKNRVILATSYGRFDMAEAYYKRCTSLIKHFINPVDECNIYNGMGYFTTAIGKYEKANGYYDDALKLILDEKTPLLIAETFYNKGINAVLAFDYDNAIKFFEITLSFIDNLEVLEFVCNISKLYGLVAISNYYNSNEYSCNFYLDKMKRFLSHVIDSNDEEKYHFWDDDMFLYYFIEGILEKKDDHFDEAIDYFLKAKKHLYNTPGFFFFGYPLLGKEMSELYEKQGLIKESKAIIHDAIEKCQEKGYGGAGINYLISKLNEEEFVYSIPDLSLSDEIFGLTHKIINETTMIYRLKQMKRHTNFLTNWQEVISEEDSKMNILKNAMTLAQNHFVLDQCMFFDLSIGELAPTFYMQTVSIHLEDVRKIKEIASNHPSGFVISRTDKRYNEYKELTDIFGTDKIVSIMCVPVFKGRELEYLGLFYISMHTNFLKNTVLLNGDDLTIMRVAFRQLVDTIDKIEANDTILKMNEELMKVNDRLQEIAVTDALTGLLNRQGFAKKIDEYEGSVSEDRRKEVVIMYFDIDNFKYINDTFGHDIGDCILVEVSKILIELAGDDGVAIRYGGDEFIIMLSNYTEESAAIVATKFYMKLERKNYFINRLEEKVRRSVHIDDDKRISSSIGIAITDYGMHCDIMRAIIHADEALYYVKKTTKKNYMTWTNLLRIKHEKDKK